MDALNFLKFWKQATMTTTSEPHLVVETDTESDEDDSFFDLELTLNDLDNKENQNDDVPKQTTTTEFKTLCTKDMFHKTENDVPLKTPIPLSPSEPISKRKVLPIEPISKPQSPIALLRSAPSFRIFMFRKRNRAPPQKTEHSVNETKVFAVKLNVNDFRSSPALSRDNSTRSFGSKVRSCNNEEPKPEKFSKEVLRKYLKLIKPLYVKVSKKYGDKVKFSSGEGFASSPSSSPSVASVSSRMEKQGKGMKVVSKHLGKSRSASSSVAGVGSPAKKSDDTLQQQHDGIQSAILHCKKSFNSREGSMYSVRNSFEGEHGA